MPQCSLVTDPGNMTNYLVTPNNWLKIGLHTQYAFGILPPFLKKWHISFQDKPLTTNYYVKV